MIDLQAQYRMLESFSTYILYADHSDLTDQEVELIDAWLDEMQTEYRKGESFPVPVILDGMEDEFARCELTGLMGRTISVGIYA